jgi:hypothetical protein
MKGAPGAQTKQVDNLIRTLALGVSFQQVRVIIGKELQGWISNHADGASEALVSMLQGLPTFCTTNTKDDQNFLIALLRLRMTPKAPLLAPVLSAVEGFLRAHAQYVSVHFFDFSDFAWRHRLWSRACNHQDVTCADLGPRLPAGTQLWPCSTLYRQR